MIITVCYTEVSGIFHINLFVTSHTEMRKLVLGLAESSSGFWVRRSHLCCGCELV